MYFIIFLFFLLSDLNLEYFLLGAIYDIKFNILEINVFACWNSAEDAELMETSTSVLNEIGTMARVSITIDDPILLIITLWAML